MHLFLRLHVSVTMSDFYVCIDDINVLLDFMLVLMNDMALG